MLLCWEKWQDIFSWSSPLREVAEDTRHLHLLENSSFITTEKGDSWIGFIHQIRVSSPSADRNVAPTDCDLHLQGLDTWNNCMGCWWIRRQTVCNILFSILRSFFSGTFSAGINKKRNVFDATGGETFCHSCCQSSGMCSSFGLSWHWCGALFDVAELSSLMIEGTRKRDKSYAWLKISKLPDTDAHRVTRSAFLLYLSLSLSPCGAVLRPAALSSRGVSVPKDFLLGRSALWAHADLSFFFSFKRVLPKLTNSEYILWGKTMTWEV